MASRAWLLYGAEEEGVEPLRVAVTGHVYCACFTGQDVVVYLLLFRGWGWTLLNSEV
jgi:hypothetical protein